MIEFISLGPGEAELITLKALRRLQMADVILCPASKRGQKLSGKALTILHELGFDEKKIEAFYVPMSKDRLAAEAVYRAMMERTKELHLAGKHIAFTAEGDAGFYSTTQYITELLEAEGIATTRTAGVPAFIAAGVRANLHIAFGDHPLVVYPGKIDPETALQQLREGHRLVLMKCSMIADEIKALMRKTNHNIDWHYFEHLGYEKEYYSKDKAEIAERAFPYFSLIIVGQTDARSDANPSTD